MKSIFFWVQALHGQWIWGIMSFSANYGGNIVRLHCCEAQVCFAYPTD